MRLPVATVICLVAAVLLCLPSYSTATFLEHLFYEDDSNDESIHLRDLDISDIVSEGSGNRTLINYNIVINEPVAYYFWSVVALFVFLICCGVCGWCCCCCLYCKSRRRGKAKIYTTRIEEIFSEKENLELTSAETVKEMEDTHKTSICNDSKDVEKVAKSNDESTDSNTTEGVKLEEIKIEKAKVDDTQLVEEKKVNKKTEEVETKEVVVEKSKELSDTPTAQQKPEKTEVVAAVEPATVDDKKDKQVDKAAVIKETDPVQINKQSPVVTTEQQTAVTTTTMSLDLADLDITLQSFAVNTQLSSATGIPQVTTDPSTSTAAAAAANLDNSSLDDILKDLMSSDSQSTPAPVITEL